MAKYDSAEGTTDYQDRTPAGRLNPRAMTAGGSDGEAIGRDQTVYSLGEAIVSTPHASSQVAADLPRTTVTNLDANLLSQTPSREPFTGVTNLNTASFPGSGAPSSHIVGGADHNPNSLGVGGHG